MASQSDLEKLVGKALLDAAFRNWLFTDPVAAAASIGVALTPEQANAIKGLGPQVGNNIADYVNKPVGQLVLNLWGASAVE
ncbi:MAG: hypothetical protein IT330_11390 [Anaerolineae bacterium]|nr:hypothetical protein [Anaerolineae bacterium]